MAESFYDFVKVRGLDKIHLDSLMEFLKSRRDDIYLDLVKFSNPGSFDETQIKHHNGRIKELESLIREIDTYLKQPVTRKE